MRAALAIALLFCAAAARAAEFKLTFIPNGDPIAYSARYSIDGVETIVPLLPEPVDGALAANIAIDARPLTRVEFAVSAGGDWSEIVGAEVPLLCARLDVTGDGTVSSLDAAWIAQVAARVRECR